MEFRCFDSVFRITRAGRSGTRHSARVGSSRAAVRLLLSVSCVLLIVRVAVGLASQSSGRLRYFDESSGRRLPFDRMTVDQQTGDVFTSVSTSGDLYRLTGDTLRPKDVYRWTSLGGSSVVVMTSVLQLMPSLATRLVIQCVDFADQSSECSAIDIDAKNDLESSRRIPVMIDVGTGLSNRVNRSVGDKVIAFFANEQSTVSSPSSSAGFRTTVGAKKNTTKPSENEWVSSPFYIAMSDVSAESEDVAASNAASVSAYRVHLKINQSLSNSSPPYTVVSSPTIRYYRDGPEGLHSGVSLDGSRRREVRQLSAESRSSTSAGNAGKTSQLNDDKRLVQRIRKSQIGTVKYIYGFEDELDGSVYFLGVRRRLNDHVETRLSRVCTVGRDSGFRSYVELVLVCRRRSTVMTNYNEAVAAFVGRHGGKAPASSSTPHSSSAEALYVVMAKSDSTSSANEHFGFGLCVYPMERIRQELAKAQQDCYRGTGHILAWITASEPHCVENVSVSVFIYDDMTYEEYLCTFYMFLLSCISLIHMFNHLCIALTVS